MDYRPLGTTDLKVSVICLGTMTWGEQNTEADAHAQLDLALDCGVNFIDTAEMYPVPPRRETQGLTETYIGTWLASRRCRDKVVLATKVVGPAPHMPYIRNAQARLDEKNIKQALEDSLRRLQTDYIDLYQLHWPDREVNKFGQLGYRYPGEEETVPLEVTLGVLQELQQSGKIRHIGVSNETPWGVMTCLAQTKHFGKPRIQSIQNPYSLLNRSFEVGLAEIAIREQCGLLAYSPMAFGLLSGKYLGGAKPEGARLTRFNVFTRYNSPQSLEATRRYVDIARRHGLSPAQMALAFVTDQPFVTSNIIGATTLEQLRENIDSVNVTLLPDVLAEIEAVHQAIPNPAP